MENRPVFSTTAAITKYPSDANIVALHSADVIVIPTANSVRTQQSFCFNQLQIVKSFETR